MIIESKFQVLCDLLWKITAFWEGKVPRVEVERLDNLRECRIQGSSGARFKASHTEHVYEVMVI